MNILRYYIFVFVGALGVLYLSSCGSSSPSKYGRYSSATKREKADRKSSSEKSYSNYKKNNTSEKPNTSKGNKNSLPVLRNDIINTAMFYIGTSYTSGGKSPDNGFDCSGFTAYVFSQNGIPLKGSSDNMAQLGKERNREDLLPGDLVFFGSSEKISHVAIVSENKDKKLKVVHATTSSGVKTDVISDYKYWESRYLYGKDILSK